MYIIRSSLSIITIVWLLILFMIFSDSCNYGSNLNAKPQRINSTHLIKIKKKWKFVMPREM